MPHDTRPLSPRNPSPVPPGVPAGSQRRQVRGSLEGCWAPLWRVLEPAVEKVLLEALSPLAKNEDPNEARPAKIVLARSSEFRVAYHAACRAEFDLAIADFVAHKGGEKPAAKLSLSLVEYDDQELATQVERGSARIRNAIDESYGQLKIRLANLVKEREIRDGENPFRPAIFYRPLYTALEKAQAPREKLFAMLRQFDASLLKVMSAMYGALDAHLGQLGLSADVATVMGPARHTIQRGGRNTARGFSDSMMGTASGMMTEGGQLTSGGAEQILQALYQRLQLPMAQPGAAVYAPAQNTAGRLQAALAATPLVSMLAPGLFPTAPGAMQPMAGTPGALAIQGVPTAAPGAMQALAGVPTPPGMYGGAPLEHGTMVPVVVDAALLNAINDVQKLSAIALTAASQGKPPPDAAVDNAELRNKLADKATQQVDKLTIEIVGLLFDRIAQDRLIPAEIKKVIQRLQFPLIKVALTDPELFVAPDQPARQLLDRIASTAVGWTGEGEENERYYEQVHRAVGTVLAATDSGLEVFARALAEFETYLTEERQRDDDPVERAKRALAEAETREVMAINAAIKIRSIFEGVQLESYLRDFLLDTWVRVLVAAALHDRGPDGERMGAEAVKRYLGIVPELIWSVQPKINPDDRRRLVGTIPPVLTTLREGVMLIEWPLSKVQEFFAKLMNSHAQAVKALELAHGVVSPIETSTLRIRLEGLDLTTMAELPPEAAMHLQVSDNVVRQVLATNRVNVNHLTLPRDFASEPTADDAVAGDRIDAQIAKWQRGDWFNLTLGDVTERVRLRWVSPRKTLYLFTPADGRKAHSLAPETLRAYVRAGDIEPVEAEPLFERAVHGIADDLRQVFQGAPG